MSQFPWETSSAIDPDIFHSESQLESSLEHKEFYGKLCSLKVAVGTNILPNEEIKTYIRLQSANGFRVTPEINWECTCQGTLERTVLISALKYVIALLESKAPMGNYKVTPMEFVPDIDTQSTLDKVEATPPPMELPLESKVKRRSRKKPVEPQMPTAPHTDLEVDSIITLEDEAGISGISSPNFSLNEDSIDDRINQLIGVSESSTRSVDLEYSDSIAVTNEPAHINVHNSIDDIDGIESINTVVNVDTVALRKAYYTQGLSISQFVKKAGIHFTTFSKLIHGKSDRCRIGLLIKVANCMNVPVIEFIRKSTTLT